jgi:hypothetical protein
MQLLMKFAKRQKKWSLSQYRENFYVRNPIERYQTGSGMPLKYNADGSLDVPSEFGG